MTARTMRMTSPPSSAQGIQIADIPTQTTACMTITPNGVAAEAAPMRSHKLCTQRT